MIAANTNIMFRFLSPTWLTGPIFAKELRVTSRRRRYYYLRFFYLALLTISVVIVWSEATGSIARFITQPTPRAQLALSTNLTAQMARVGQTIILFIIWFQFFAAQIVAIVLLSNAISDEIYRRTLGVLTTTPITSFQIVMGKLSSRILQLILLSAITFPLLAIVRVFGGVPWSFLVSSICITLSTVVFVAALTLFFSIFTRRAYIVIIIAFLTLALLFLGLGFQFFVRGPLFGLGQGGLMHNALFYMNPYAVLATSSDLMTDPSLAAKVTLNWPLNCAVLLGASVAILMVSTMLVRKVAMLQASTSVNVFVAWWRSHTAGRIRRKPSPRPVRPIRHVTGPPIVWRELICPLSSRYKYVSASILLFEMAMLLAIYLFPAVTDIVGYAGTHSLYVYIFMGFATLMTIVPSATTITSEKESCTWPLLLSTAVSDWQIILGKIAGALRRSLLLWILLVVYLVLFSWARLLHAVSIIQIAMIGISILAILTASGIYFSARLRHTTTAVMVNFGFALAIWLILPVLCIAVMEILHADRSWWALPYELNPFFQAGVVIEATADLWQLSYYHQIAPFQWYHGDMTMVQSTWFIFASMLMYFLFAAILIWRAKRILRRNI